MARGSRRGGGRGGDRGFRGGDRGGRFGDRGWRDIRGRRGDRFGPPSRTDYRLYIDNLSSSTSWQDLKDVMRKGGEVTFADKQGQREGIVEFASKADMKNALKKCDGLEVGGRRIRVTEERPSRSGSDSRSRSRTPARREKRSESRSRSRTRSRS